MFIAHVRFSAFPVSVFDVDGDKRIMRSDLQRLLGGSTSALELDEVFRSANVSGTGYLDFYEFVRMDVLERLGNHALVDDEVLVPVRMPARCSLSI